MIPQNAVTRRQFLSMLPIVPIAILEGTVKQFKQREYNPKFNIGDYVELHLDLEECPNFYERGEIIGLSFEDGKWDYRLVIRECSGASFLGMVDEAHEEELTLIRRA